jgi:hypothetical protein
MKTASLKSSSPSSQNPDAGKVRTQGRRRIKADHGTRGSWSKKPVTGLFNESGEININIMLGMLFEFLKDYDHSIGLKD